MQLRYLFLLSFFLFYQDIQSFCNIIVKTEVMVDRRYIHYLNVFYIFPQHYLKHQKMLFLLCFAHYLYSRGILLKSNQLTFLFLGFFSHLPQKRKEAEFQLLERSFLSIWIFEFNWDTFVFNPAIFYFEFFGFVKNNIFWSR